MAFATEAWRGLCRASYYISLLGLKIPLGLLLRASHASYVLAWIVFAWVPFLLCCHAWLLPKVQDTVVAWHIFTALWVTIPLLVVGAVILSVARAPGNFAAFAGALAAVAAWHVLAIPGLAGSWAGAVLLHALFAFFEDMPTVAWVWCLVYVVRLQRHARTRQAGREPPFATPEGEPQSSVLVVGNAPTVTDGAALGAAIDAFAQVARFNSYSVDRPEYTGSRVSYHFCNGRNFPASNAVKAVLPLFNASLTHAVYLFMPHMEDTQEIFAKLTSTKVDAWFVEEAQILALRRKIGCRFWQIPTSGMVAIDSFLAKNPFVTLHGFNFFQGKKIHYFEESPTQLITSWLERFVTHDPSREKRWVQGLLQEGRTVFLSKQGGMVEAEEDKAEDEAIKAKLEGPEKKLKARDGEPRRRPGLVQTLLRDGLPSQFSL